MTVLPETPIEWAFFIAWTFLSILFGAMFRELGKDIYMIAKKWIFAFFQGYRYTDEKLRKETEVLIDELEEFAQRRERESPEFGTGLLVERQFRQETDQKYRQDYHKKVQKCYNEFNKRGIEIEYGVGDISLSSILSKDKITHRDIQLINKKLAKLVEKL